jgi:hypothetical protein
MTPLEIYSITINIILAGVVVIVINGAGGVQRKLMVAEKFAKLAVKFACSISNKPDSEVVHDFNKFVDKELNK